METKAKKSPKKASAKSKEVDLVAAYIEHVLNEGKRPASVFKFCTDIGIKEDSFYNQFGSFEGLERHIWKTFVTRTVDRLHADGSYSGFSTREKILAFYYTFFEELKSFRSYVLVQLENQQRLEIIPGFLKDFKSEFEHYIEQELTLGQVNGEVAKRPYLDKKYPQIFWFHMTFLLMFWRNDNSTGFEQTDAAVEKSVNLAFDLIGKGAVDSFVDFAKFLYQTKVR